MRGQRRMARQTPPGARPNRGAMGWLGPHPGVLLEPCGDAGPRGMVVHDRTRLSGRLRHCCWSNLRRIVTGSCVVRRHSGLKPVRRALAVAVCAGVFFGRQTLFRSRQRFFLDLRTAARSDIDSGHSGHWRCARIVSQRSPGPTVNTSRNNTSRMVLKQEYEDCCKILIPLTKFPDFVLDSPQRQV